MPDYTAKAASFRYDGILLHKKRPWTLAFKHSDTGVSATLELPTLDSTDKTRRQANTELKKIFPHTYPEPFHAPKSIQYNDLNTINIRSENPEGVKQLLRYAANNRVADFKINVEIDASLVTGDGLPPLFNRQLTSEFKNLLHDCGVDKSVAKLLNPHTTDVGMQERIEAVQEYCGVSRGVSAR